MTELVQRFERNIAGKDYVVGDIHGCFTRLADELERIGFRANVDRLFSVGDLVDRGPESEQSIEWLNHSWFHPVRGNHEDMAIRFPEGNMDVGKYAANGGAWNIGLQPYESLAFSDAFNNLPVAIQVETSTGTVGIVHADCPTPTWAQLVDALTLFAGLVPGVKNPLPPGLGRVMLKSIYEACLWSRDRVQGYGNQGEVSDVRAVVVGHTPMQRFTSLGNVLYIDTGAVFKGRGSAGGFFTILDLETLRPV